MSHLSVYLPVTWVILETDGSIWKIKKGIFYYKKVKKYTTYLSSPYVHSLDKSFDKIIEISYQGQHLEVGLNFSLY